MFIHDYVKLNGIEHFTVVYEAEEKEAKPVLLYVHGGPGLSESLFAWNYRLYTGNDLNLVFYDMRGAGRTFAKNPDLVPTEEEIEADLEAMVAYVTERFGKKPVLLARNYGTIPAIRLARKHPEKLCCYIGYQQVTNGPKTNEIRFARVRELAERSHRRLDLRKVDKIEKLTGGTFDKALLTGRQLTSCNTLLDKYNVSTGMDKNLLKMLPKSPLYDMSDIKLMMNSPKQSRKLGQTLKSTNLYEEGMEFALPMFFISGNWDYTYPYTMVEEYYGKILAPKKQFKLLEDIGANAMTENGTEFWNGIRELIAAADGE